MIDDRARNEGWKVAVVGATGAVGAEMIKVLHDRGFPVSSLRLFASPRSAGRVVATPFGDRTIEAFTVAAAREMDIVLLAVSGSFAEEFAPQIVSGGRTVVIDNSSAFRYKDDVPLVVPEVNADKVRGGAIIANPNCTTAILCMALHPLLRTFGLVRVIVSTYQAASGAGAAGMTELEQQARAHLGGDAVRHQVFRHPLAFNVIPHIDSFQENGYTREEMKVVWETRKILDMPSLSLSCTAVRVPTFRVHAESVTVETERRITPELARLAFRDAPGIKVVDDPGQFAYPMPITATGRDDVEVGRIRQSLVFGDRGLDFFLCGDQLLKGAALNAVQIAEVLTAHAPRDR